MEKISWTDCVRKEEVLRRVAEEWSILKILKIKNINCIGHILRKNCLLKHVTEGKIERSIEVTERRGRRR